MIKSCLGLQLRMLDIAATNQQVAPPPWWMLLAVVSSTKNCGFPNISPTLLTQPGCLKWSDEEIDRLEGLEGEGDGEVLFLANSSFVDSNLSSRSKSMSLNFLFFRLHSLTIWVIFALHVVFVTSYDAVTLVVLVVPFQTCCSNVWEDALRGRIAKAVACEHDIWSSVSP